MAVYRELTLKRSREKQDEVMQAYLEATVLRVRYLIEFLAGRYKKGLCGEPDRRDWNRGDLRPSNFVEGWKPPTLHRLDGYLSQADKLMAHLSLRRTTKIEPPVWALDAMVEGVLLEFQAFVLVAEQQGSEFAASFRRAYEQAHATFGPPRQLNLPRPRLHYLPPPPSLNPPPR